MLSRSIHQLGLAGIASFLVINSPSIKLFVGNISVVNVVATVAALSVLFLYAVYYRFRIKSSWVISFAILSIVLFISVISGVIAGRADDAFVNGALRFIYIIFIFLVTSLISQRTDISVYLTLQIIWGIVVAICMLSGVIQYASGQHYNTATLPIGMSVVASLLILIDTNSVTRTTVCILVGGICISILGLLSLAGRSPFIFTIAIITVLSSIRHKLITDNLKSMVKGVVALLGVGTVGAAGVSYLDLPFSDLLFVRLIRLIEGGDEARTQIYQQSVEIIAYYPAGLGFGGYSYLGAGNYPHNFIVEGTIAGGILAGALLSFAVAFALWKMILSVRSVSQSDMLPMVGCVLYLVLTFLVSYSLQETYMLFGAIALGLAASK